MLSGSESRSAAAGARLARRLSAALVGDMAVRTGLLRRLLLTLLGRDASPGSLRRGANPPGQPRIVELLPAPWPRPAGAWCCSAWKQRRIIERWRTSYRLFAHKTCMRRN
jgi:hypothetical protein